MTRAPVAEIGPLRPARRQFFSRSDLFDVITRHQADPALTGDLARLAGGTTDELDPL